MTTRTAILLLIGFLACAGRVAADSTWVYHDAKLDNGLRVISLEDHSSPIAAVQVWYHVGSKDENSQRQGFAHMFEHMMFRGTDRIGPEDHFKYLRKYGGAVNGYTTFDTTVYIQEVPANQLDLTFWLEAERMANLKINEEYFQKEREVVKEEYRLRVADPPYGQLFTKVFDFAFKQHPYRWTPIGNLDHLNAATAEELRQFFKTYYVPNNATLVVVGDVNHDEVLAKAKQYFEWIPRPPDPPRVAAREPEMTEPRRLDFTEPVGPLPAIGVGYHVCPDGHADSYPLKVLEEIVSGGESGRVNKHLVKEQEKFTFAGAGSILMEQGGIFGVGGVIQPGGDQTDAEKAVLAEIKDLVDHGVTEEELQKARNNLVAQSVTERTRVAGKAQRLGYCAVVLGDVSLVNRELDLLMKVSCQDVQDVARKYFKDERQLTLVVTPAIAKLNPFRGLFDDKKKADSNKPASAETKEQKKEQNGDGKKN